MGAQMDERKFSDCLLENLKDLLIGTIPCLLTVVTARVVLFYAPVITGSLAASEPTMGVSTTIAAVAVAGFIGLILTCFQTLPAATEAWKDVLKCGWDALGGSDDLWYPENSLMMKYPLVYQPGSMIYQWGLPGPIIMNWAYSGRYNPNLPWVMI